MTVKELIDILSELPSNSDVVIDDAYTNWKLAITNVELSEETNRVSIGGDYGDVIDNA